ncbi:hypothetical protein [Campylobacter sp. RM16190]|uniref:hypothetical protein n=1 Tax=Campylobacter sp. RM16190 TaxID=1705727 RepID=UPI001472D576|nr:hypothetical protein [Campylobacter sp. RM16190]
MKKEIAKVTISEPYLKYQTVVSHFSIRKITTFEWLLLELLANYEKTNFSISNLAVLFNDIFFISDFEKTILPILKSLKSKGLLSCDDLDDHQALTMQDIELSSDGRAFLDKGEIPTDIRQEEVTFSYDMFNKKLDLHYKNRKTQPIGIEICVDEKPTVKKIEAVKILESQKSKFKWFVDSTQINKIELHSSTKEWEHIKNGVLIDKYGHITLTENNKDFLEEFFRYIESEWKSDEKLNDFEYFNFEQIEKFHDNLSFFNNDDVLLFSQKAHGIRSYPEVIKKYSDKNINKIKILLVCESDEFDIKIYDKQIIVKVIDKMPLENCLLCNYKQNVCLANFAVKYYNRNSKISLFYSLKMQNCVDGFLSKIISEYLYKNSDIIYLALFLKNEVRNKVILEWFDSLIFKDNILLFYDRVEIFYRFLHKTAQIKDEKTSSEIKEYILLNNKRINSLDKNDEIFEYIELTQMIYNERIYDKLHINSYDDLIQFMRYLKSNELEQNKFIKKYYPKFFTQISQIENLQKISEVEIAINEIRLLCKDILDPETRKENLDQIKSMINTIYRLTEIPVNDIENTLLDSTIRDLINRKNNKNKKRKKKK